LQAALLSANALDDERAFNNDLHEPGRCRSHQLARTLLRKQPKGIFVVRPAIQISEIPKPKLSLDQSKLDGLKPSSFDRAGQS
jgi:hypothetical protein